jgi:hypothetical protein
MISARELLTASPLALAACVRSDQPYFGNPRLRKTQAAAWFRRRARITRSCCAGRLAGSRGGFRIDWFAELTLQRAWIDTGRRSAA